VQVEFLWDLDDETYGAVLLTSKKVAVRLKQVIGKPYVGMQVYGMDVAHAHVHIFAFSSQAEYDKRRDMEKVPDHAILKEMADRLHF
jgi:histidine triad (HIT) family protein